MALDNDQEKIASILYEYEDTKRTLNLKTIEAQRLGETMMQMATALRQNPAYVKFVGQAVPVQYGMPNIAGPFERSDFDGEKIQALTEEVRNLQIKLDSLTQQRMQLGFPVS